MKRPSQSKAKPVKGDVIALVLGSVFLIVILIIALLIPSPTDFQLLVFRVALALGAALVGSAVPGIIVVIIRVKVPGSVRAGGAIALFVFVYLVNPPALLRPKRPAEPVRVSVSSTEARSECDATATIQGTVRPSSYPGSVYPMVQSEVTSAWYVQGPCSVSSGGLRCTIELGDPGTPCGTPYEVVLIASQRGLVPGRISAFPSGLDARSDSVKVRK